MKRAEEEAMAAALSVKNHESYIHTLNGNIDGVFLVTRHVFYSFFLEVLWFLVENFFVNLISVKINSLSFGYVYRINQPFCKTRLSILWIIYL